MILSFDTNYGLVTVKNVMIDIDGTNLMEGIEIVTEDITFQISEYIDLNELEIDMLEKLIEENLESL